MTDHWQQPPAAAGQKVQSITLKVGEHEVYVETGRLARSASGAVVVRCEDTVLLVTATGRVFAYGDAPNDGDMSGTHLNGSIVAASGS